VTRRQLPTELVALIHHIELAQAGWADRLTDQLVLSAALLSTGPSSPDELRQQLEPRGIHLSLRQIQGGVQRLLGSHSVLELAEGRVVVTEAARLDAAQRRNAAEVIERGARRVFAEALVDQAVELNPDMEWEGFCSGCLDPLIGDIGARTYELLSGMSAGGTADRAVVSFLECYPEHLREQVGRAAVRFLSSDDPHPRGFILQRLQGHLLSLAANLPERSVVALAARVRRGLRMRVLLDTNFIFSLLGLHESPANELAMELAQILAGLRSHLRVTLYALDSTIDEAKRTLAGYEFKLSEIAMSPKLGSIVTSSSSHHMSGIALRYLEAAAASRHRLSAEEFFRPYLTDLESLLRSRGVKPYDDAATKGLSTSQRVINDILDQQEFEKRRYPDRAKPYEALSHDITLWHAVARRRPLHLESPLDAEYWVVTEDYRLLGFDAHKQRKRRAAVPVCVHPTVLVQMLQLWLPRTEGFQRAMFQSVRALVPQFFDADAEEVTIRILRSLSRYEDVDDLPESAITSILMNKALRTHLSAESDVNKQIALVRDAIVAEAAEIKEQLDRERAKVTELAATLRSVAEEKSSIEDAIAGEREARERERVQLQSQLKEEEDKRRALEEKLIGIESVLSSREAVDQAQVQAAARKRSRVRFAVLACCSLVAALALPVALEALLANLAGYPGSVLLRVIAGSIAVFGWVILVELLGRRSSAISEWRLFGLVRALRRWVVAAVVAVGLNLIANGLWELLRRRR
jgi:hypothetical protein